jgi:hypothetical protein
MHPDGTETLRVATGFAPVEELIAAFAPALGGDLAGYRNHVCRVLNYYVALRPPADDLPEVVMIAAAFHDLGIWTARTFDYLEPSVRLAQAHLAGLGREHLGPEVAALISEHHKLRPFTGAYAATVEAFRRADLVDLSLGLLRGGLPASFVHAVKAAFPNAGFHRRLVQLTARQFLRTPWRPLPMLRW